jgi:pimeloyl-ACP methyl ester carboxylesterase
MQRRAFELQAAAETAPEGSDPLAENLEALSGAHVPALLLVGEHDMSDFHEAAIALVGALPDSRRATLLGAGHLAPLEQPALFRRLLFDFLGA